MISQPVIDAAADAVHEAAFGQELPEAPIDLARAALEAAMPHIRKQIARDIRAEMVGRNWNKTFLNGLEYGAYIAEKGLTQ